MSAYLGKDALVGARFWHLTDIHADAAHVRFREKADTPHRRSKVR